MFMSSVPDTSTSLSNVKHLLSQDTGHSLLPLPHDEHTSSARPRHVKRNLLPRVLSTLNK